MSTSPSTSRPGSTQSSDPKAPLSPEQLESARKMEILDKDGEKMTFGDVTLGKRISVVFIRHFCGSPNNGSLSGVNLT